MHAEQRAKITERVSSCYLPEFPSEMVNLVNMTLKSSRHPGVSTWTAVLRGKTGFADGMGLVRSAGAHPVVCVGPEAHDTPNRDQITSGDESRLACILARVAIEHTVKTTVVLRGNICLFQQEAVVTFISRLWIYKPQTKPSLLPIQRSTSSLTSL